MLTSSRKLFQEIQTQLQAVYGREEAGNIAFLLLEHYFDLNKPAVLTDKAIEGDITFIKPLIERLLNHEPVQYVLGRTYFYGHWFDVNSSVLIPRPETEELVDWIITTYATKKQEKLTILDIGTGSGCIAISLAAAMPHAEVWAMDISEAALQTAASNARLNQVKVNFIEGNILETHNWNLLPDFIADIVVSNPPYVTHTERPLMRRNVTDFEPHLALFVPDIDPLLFYRHIARFCNARLNPEGNCFVETNEQFTQEVATIFSTNFFSQTEIKQDIFGKSRFVKALR
jgi:release factor glutamine methyltransferase